MMKNKISQKKRGFMENAEDINPMHSLGNLSDIMLVLAVGMMLALVVAWNVDLVGIGTRLSSVTTEGLVQFTQEDDTVSSLEDDGIDFNEYGLTEYGIVYIDKEGNMYVYGALNESSEGE